MITAGIALLAQRLAAVARLRAAYCLRTGACWACGSPGCCLGLSEAQVSSARHTLKGSDPGMKPGRPPPCCSSARDAARFVRSPPTVPSPLALPAARVPAEGMQQVAAFRAALEKASGETYQRPSPTDSNTSTSISVPLDAASNAAAAAKPAGTAGSNPSRSSTPTGGRGRVAPPAAAAAGAKAPAVPAEALVGMPKAVLERQLLAAQHSQAMATALSAFAKSSERLREFMGQAAAQVGRLARLPAVR